jgi:hypothetical protein
MRARWLVPALVAGVVCASIATVAVSALRSSPYLYVRPQMGEWSGATMWGATPQVRPRLQAEVLDVALADPRTSLILGDEYRVIGDSSQGNGVLIHVDLLGEPRSYDLELPYSSYGTVEDPPDECRLPRYVMGWYHDAASGVTEAAIVVDLRRRRVIQVMTYAARHHTSWVTGKPHPACPYPKEA